MVILSSMLLRWSVGFWKQNRSKAGIAPYLLQDSKTAIALRNEVYLNENKNVVNKMLLTT